MCKKTIFSILLLAICSLTALAQQVTIGGNVIDEETQKPVEFASVLMKENGFWAITGTDGSFSIRNIPVGKVSLTIQCLGYATRQITLDINRDIPRLRIKLKQENLKLDEVTVTAKRKDNEGTTSYTIDRTALDNQQILNVGDVSTLLPGGKTINSTLMSDNRMALRSGSQEKGSASFGTAIEIDGMRLDNNAATGETAGASTRTIGASNIESIEIITGIPSVEYGDLSNGVVKVNTRKGKSPFIIEGKLNQHTQQIALNKGFDLGSHYGVLNTSIEHARSFSNAASPHTAYQRNILSLHYMNIFMRETTPLTLNIGLAGNIGGYNAESDPDNELDDYTKTRDNTFRGHFELNWLLNKRWITNLSLRGSLSVSDHSTESYTHTNSATTLAYLHALEEGYFIASDYDSHPDAPIILGPTGYWHVKQFQDSKPLNGSLRLKADWTRRFGQLLSRLMVGAEYTGSRNNGRGTYYDDMRYAPTWREYRYDDLPALNNIALYAEEKVSINTSKLSTLEITAGLRNDITLIKGSDYGTVSSLSPRFNARYTFWKNRRRNVVSDLALHAGWGKSVKLPSFQILYPSPSYYDIEVFHSPSTADNTTVSAWYTRPSKALYNPQLKWQYTNQTDIGVEATIKGTRISLSAFHHRTYNPYMATAEYTPFSYQYTPVSALESLTIPTIGRTYSIDRTTGVVTVTAADGSSVTVPNNTRRFYQSNTRYVNASPLDRYGLEWMIDFKQFKALNTSLRFDGNYYYYKSADETFFASMNNSNTKMTGTGEPYQYIGWYRGTNGTTTATPSVPNGAISESLNLNTTITTHIPQIRLIMALRLEATLYNYHKNISNSDGDVYPEYYSTWDHPDVKIPFAEKLLWAKDNDAILYNDLQNLVVHSNTAYLMNANRISAYYSANLSVTKEIGDHVSLSFYANNFFNNMKTVHSSQTNLDTSLFSSSYIPSYYYGLSLRLKL